MACPICRDAAGTREPISGTTAHHVECATCGAYDIGDLTKRVLEGPDYAEEDRWRLSWATRRASDADAPLRLAQDVRPTITSTSEPDTLDKVDLALAHIGRRSSALGQTVRIDSRHDWPVAFARGQTEFDEALLALIALGYVTGENDNRFTLTLDGWRRIRELRERQPRSEQAFVAMWFDPSLLAAWDEGFRPALESLGYKPIRVDREEYVGKIDDFIVASIRRSGLLVADFTGHRAGVYFEAGFAMGLGIPVIFTCREDDIARAHFDTRQYNHITWKDAADLRQRLVARIEATIPVRPGNARA